MPTAADQVHDLAFSKLERDLAYVMTCFREMLSELGEPALAQRLPWLAGEVGGGGEWRDRDIHMLSIAFQLLNMVEENTATQARRLRETERGITAQPGLWGQQLRLLKEQGYSAETIQRALPLVHV